MAEAVVIKEFLAKLGFQIDEGKWRRFQDAMKTAQTQMMKFGKGMDVVLSQFQTLSVAAAGAAIGVATSMIKIGESMSQLGFVAARTGASAASISALGYAFKQMGLHASDATSMLESMANAQRMNPGLLQAFGINPNEDRAQALMDLAKRWRGENSAQAMREAQMFGFNQQQVLAMQNPSFGKFYGEEINRQQKTGLNYNQMTDLGIRMTRQVNRLQQRLSDFADYLFQTWGPEVAAGLDKLNQWFEKNSPTIKKYIDGLHQEFDNFRTSVAGYWDSLPKSTQGDLEKIGVFAAGALAIRQSSTLLNWLGRLLGLGDLAGPIGILISLASAILLLSNDYQKWKETGKGDLIDWDKWMPQIEGLKKGLFDVIDAFTQLATTLKGLWDQIEPYLEPIVNYMAHSFADLVISQLNATRDALHAITDILHGDFRKAWTDFKSYVGDSIGFVTDKLDALLKKIPTWLLQKLVNGGADLRRYLFGHGDDATVQNQAYIGGEGMMGATLQQAAFRPFIFSQPGANDAGAEQMFSRLEAMQGLPQGILDRVWATESGRSKSMVSRAGALGPFQFMPETAARLGVNNPFNLAESASGAARFLRQLMDRFHGNIAAALAAYNWGPGNVEQDMQRWGDAWTEHLPAETSGYLQKILGGEYRATPPSGSIHHNNSRTVNVDAPVNVSVSGVAGPDQTADRLERMLYRHHSSAMHQLATRTI